MVKMPRYSGASFLKIKKPMPDEALPNKKQIIGNQIRSADNFTWIIVENTSAGKVVCMRNFETDFASCGLMKPKDFNKYPIEMINKADPKTTLGDCMLRPVWVRKFGRYFLCWPPWILKLIFLHGNFPRCVWQVSNLNPNPVFSY